MALTKVTGHVIKSDTNIISHNINSSGIITAVTFDGNVSGVAVTFTGDSTIGSLGITTNLTVGGISTFAGITTVTGDTLFAKQINASGITTLGNRIFAGGTSIPGYTGADDLTIGNETGGHGITIRSNASSIGGLFFSRATSPGNSATQWDGGLEYAHSSAELRFYNGGNVTAMFKYGHFQPWSDSQYDLGTTSKRWRNLHADAATIAGNATISGNLTVDGVLTYQDVTNIDSIGIITARSNIDCNGSLDVDGHTDLDNVSIAGVTTVANNTYLTFGANATANTNLRIKHNSSNTRNEYRATYQDFFTTDLRIHNISNNAHFAYFWSNQISLFASGTERLQVNTSGAKVLGNLELSSSYPSLTWTDTNHNSDFRITNDDGKLIVYDTTRGAHVMDFLANGDVRIRNDKGLYLGEGNDLLVAHDGSLSRISDTFGHMKISSNVIEITNQSLGENYIKCTNNAAVDLYYDNAVKLTTSATGITVGGEVAASQDYPLTKPVLDFNFAAEKKLDPRFQFTRESIATFIDKKGIVRYSSENQPRFDHHPTSGVSLGLLLERQQTNYQEYSVLMSQSNIKNNITVTDNFAISPDGTQNASKIVNATSNNAQTNIAWNGTSVASGSYAMWSIWLKSEETSCIIQIFSNTYIFGADRINIELADGTYGGTSASSTFRFNIEKYPNKWWRISVGGNGVNAAGGWYIGVVDSKTAARGATCGSATNKTWFAWGVQEEISIHSRIATSYIPTNGAAVLRKGDRATMDGDDFDDFFDRFQGTIVNEHSNALQSMEGGGSGWEFNNDQLQVNLIAQTGSGYAHSHYPGCQASVFGDRNSGGSGGSGSPATDYLQVYGPNSTIVNGGIQNGAANSGYGRYPGNTGGIPDYTRYYRTWTDAMSYDLTPSTNILRTATGGATTEGTNTESISLANVSKFELGNDATDLLYSNFYGRIKRWVYYDKVLPLSQLANLTSQLPQSYL